MDASVGQWLTCTGAVPGGYRVSQGKRLRRAGDISITPDAGGNVCNVWVGGATNTLFRGAALV